MSAGLRHRGGRNLPIAVGVVAVVGVASALAAFAAGVFAGEHSSWSFGSFAGYVWRGKVTSVAASWTVPRVVAGSHWGAAGTWVGAQAQGPEERAPFIQIGTNEQVLLALARRSGATVTEDFAFWSDTSHHFHAQTLFAVHPGDRISARLVLAHRKWALTIIDATSGASAHFLTAQETHAPFNLAEWLQEDIQDKVTGKPYPYPHLTTVGLRALAVNGRKPSYAEMDSQWMSIGKENLAPSRLRDDSFALGAATISPAGAHYLNIAGRDDAATRALLAVLARPTSYISYAQLADAIAKFDATVRRNITMLKDTRWPATVAATVQIIIRDNRLLLHHLQPNLFSSFSTPAARLSAFNRYAVAVGREGHLVRRALHIPEFTPAR